MSRVIVSLSFLALLLSPIESSAADAPPLQIAVGTASVRVTNATAGGDVILFSSSLDSKRGLLWQYTEARSVAADGTGSLAFAPPWRVRFRSIWIAIDVASGRYAVGGPIGYDVAILPFPTQLLKKDADGVLGLFGAQILSADMVVVRPKEGAWRATAIEANTGDADREKDGRLSFAIVDAIPIPGTKTSPPRRLKNGDVIAVTDTGVMQTFITEIGK